MRKKTETKDNWKEISKREGGEKKRMMNAARQSVFIKSLSLPMIMATR